MGLLELILATVVPIAPAASAVAASPDPHPVIELRQYKIVRGKRDEFIELFERNFIESQEELGMRLVGQFRDSSDPDRFTWIRSFDSMDARLKSLNAFYFGPVWKANRDAANPMLEDNDNVLLLRPATPALAFPKGDRDNAGRPAGVVLASVEYLWKAPDEGFTTFFVGEMIPALAAAGIEVIAGHVPEEAENNFPRLPVRREKLFIWFARANSEAELRAALDRFQSSTKAGTTLQKLRDFQERDSQFLWLHPTRRSALR